MILLCGIPSEPLIAAVIEQLEVMHEPYVLFNQREFASSDLQWSVHGGRIEGDLNINGRRHSLSSFTGIYVRLMDHTMLPELEDEPPGSALAEWSRQLHEALVTWLDIAPARVVNRFRQMGSNASKPYQAQRIRQAGFRVPETLVTDDSEMVREFARTHDRIIYKSVSGVRSIVEKMGPEQWERLELIRACPVQFQEYVEGFDVRVHTIGTELFATRVDSTGTDYRYTGYGEGGTQLTPFDLPDSVGRRCFELAHDLDLAFAGIDLRFTPDGQVVCFEVNPSPAYSYYEAHTGQPISQSLAMFLACSQS